MRISKCSESQPKRELNCKNISNWFDIKVFDPLLVFTAFVWPVTTEVQYKDGLV